MPNFWFIVEIFLGINVQSMYTVLVCVFAYVSVFSLVHCNQKYPSRLELHVHVCSFVASTHLHVLAKYFTLWLYNNHPITLQTALDEYDYVVTNLAVDLRDGLRLV